MTEQQFIKELELALHQMTADERNEIVSDIREYFSNAREDGKTDIDISSSLGSPKQIAQELLENYVPVKSQPKTFTSDKLIRIPDSTFTNVLIDLDYGALNLFPSETDETIVELIGESEKLSFVAEVIGDTLSVKLKSKKMSFFTFIFQVKELKVNVALPKKLYSTITMKSDHGRIRAEKLLGKIVKVNSDNGSILLQEIASTLMEVKTDNGRIELDRVQSDKLTTTTDNGRIELRNVDTEKVHAETDNGRITMQYVNGDILGKTDNGRIELLTTSIDRMIDLKTDNGSIMIETESDPTDVSISAKVDWGKVDIFGERNSKTVFGAGTHQVRLTSDNGRLTVAKRAVSGIKL
ncbi:DUF4097 family beta strand repeat-containing protein [uncultured Psychrobacillus sp.]|uniref:DUF4097 family beta strand repeat-containing protein n=1 Tax=uncultured Psychrobacillus sp. TaxID=1551585 RepID=UPI00260B7252|nr:DUF4097 family beta strand repeat-containing protein [uncultured Psychrobacillus sp.]